MCNLTSVAGALSTLGIENPNINRQFEDNLETIKRQQKASRTTPQARAYVANKLGVSSKQIMFNNPTKSIYISKLKPLLENGYGVITSFGSHIVRIVGVTENGLIVNDPYGKLVDFAKRATTRSNTYLSTDKNSKTSTNALEGGQRGSQNLWTWSVLQAYSLAYYEFYFKK